MQRKQRRIVECRMSQCALVKWVAHVHGGHKLVPDGLSRRGSQVRRRYRLPEDAPDSLLQCLQDTMAKVPCCHGI